MHHPIASDSFVSGDSIPEEIAEPTLAGKSILVIVQNLPVPFDRRVWQEAKTLRAAGAHVSVICPKGRGFDADFETIDGIEIYRHPLPLEASKISGFFFEYGWSIFWEARIAWRIWRKRRFDVIQGCNPPDLIFLTALMFKPLGVKYIFDHHDIVPELFEAKFGKRGFFWRVARTLEWLTFRTADVSIATNESYARIASERGGMDESDVWIVRSGPDLSRLQPVEEVPVWRNGRQHLVGYVGVMGEQEGIEFLLSAVDHLVHELNRDDIQFCLVGSGPKLEDLKTLTRKMRLEDYVTFTGSAPDQTLLEVFSTMDLGVNPDRVNAMNDKSTMNKVLEYMACSKPLVQFDVKEGRESAQDASLYAKPNDPIDFAAKIVELVDDPVRRAQMGLAGRKRIESELSWNHQIPALLMAYRRVLMGADRSSSARTSTPSTGTV